MSTPTSRTLSYYRDQGWMIEVVERWVPQARRRVDLFGFIDLIGISAHKRTWGIQATSGSNVARRVKKICSECRDAALAWLDAGNGILVVGWSKRKVKRGGKAVRWTPRVVRVSEEDVYAG